MDHQQLAQLMLNEIHASSGLVSMIYKDFDTGTISFQFAPDHVMQAGKMTRIPILLAALSLIEEGKLSFDQCVIVPNLWINPDTVAFERGSMSYSIDELISWMIVGGEDTAANVLIEIIGLKYINLCCRRLGLFNTVVESRLGQPKIANDVHNNMTSAHDILTFFEGIYRNTLLSRPLCEYAGRLFLRQRSNNGFTRYICDDIYTGRLESETETDSHEAGIFYLRYVDYFLAVFNSNPDYSPAGRLEAQRMRARISNLIFNYYLEREDDIRYQPYNPGAPYGENRY